jgi:CHAT domain-containing protein/Tfp pilus assembly protein PilF
MRLARSASFNRILAASALAVSWVLPPLARGVTASQPAATFAEEITAARIRGDYGLALDMAQAARSRAVARGAVETVEFADLERLVSTLEHIAALPETSRAEMARADSLEASFDALRVDARYAEAQSAVQEALDIQIAYLGKDHPEVALGMSRLAFAKQNLGDFAGAEPLYDEALSIQRKSLGDSHPQVARTLNWLGVMRLSQGSFEDSERLLRESLEMSKRYEDASEDIAINLCDLGHVLWRRGDYAASEKAYLESADMWRQLGLDNTPGYATCLDNLGVLYHTQGRHAEAEPLYRQALALRRKILRKDHPDFAVSLNNFAGLKWILGDYAEAEPLFREALAVKRRTLPPGHQSLALGMSNLASVVQKQGGMEEAEALYEEALEIFRSTLPAGHTYIGIVLNNLASVAGAEGDYAVAESLHTESLSIFRSNFGDKHENVATLLNNLAKDKIERGDFAGAETCLRDALEIYEQQFGRNHPSVADSRGNLGALMIRQGRYAEAEAELGEALKVHDRLLMDSSPNAVTAMSLLGSVQMQSGDIDEAIGTLETACKRFEVARRRVSVGGLKRASFTASESPYRRLAVAYMERGDGAPAWESIENDNGRGLLDLLANGSARRLTQDEMNEEQRLDKELGRLEEAYRVLSNDSTEAEAARADSIRTALLETQSHWSQYENDLARKYPIAEGRSYSLERIQSVLGENSALIGWLDAEDSHFAYVVRHEGPVIWTKLPTLQIDSLVDTYLEAVTSGRTSSERRRRLGVEIYNARIAPLEEHLAGVGRMVVVPSGAMLGVPVEALPADDGRYVVDKWEISYTPSATILAWLVNEPHAKGDPSLLVLGDPPFNGEQAIAMAANAGVSGRADEGSRSSWRGATEDRNATAALRPLGGSRKEARDIASLFGTSETLLGEDASEANLVARAARDELSAFRYIHFATHAIIDDKQAERSCLVLSQVGLPDPLESVIAGERIIDGRLTVEEVLREWHLNADLVTLSACETALGREIRGEGYIGFAQAFFRAGTRSVVVSLWKVDDRATRRLMVRFYEDMLERGMTRSASLREAKQWLRDLEGRGGIRPFSDPAFWSGFILIGDPD